MFFPIAICFVPQKQNDWFWWEACLTHLMLKRLATSSNIISAFAKIMFAKLAAIPCCNLTAIHVQECIVWLGKPWWSLSIPSITNLQLMLGYQNRGLGEEIGDELVKTCGVFDLRPVSALPENVQFGTINQPYQIISVLQRNHFVVAPVDD